MMNYNNYRHPSMENTNASPQQHPFGGYQPQQQRKIPEMFGTGAHHQQGKFDHQQSAPHTFFATNNNMQGHNQPQRFNKNVRFAEGGSEHALTPSMVRAPPPQPFYNPYHDSPTPLPAPGPYQQQGQEAPFARPSMYTHFQDNNYFSDKPPMGAPQRQQSSQRASTGFQAPQTQAYYGVPGFYTPDYGDQSLCSEEPVRHGERETRSYELSTPNRARAATPHRLHGSQARHVERSPSPLTPAAPPSSPVRPASRKRTAASASTITQADPEIPHQGDKKIKTRFSMEDNSADTKEQQQQETPAGPHVFSGSVQRVIKWYPLAEQSPGLLFEVIATLKGLRRLDTHVELLLHDDTGPVLQALFYEIDRPISPEVKPGKIVRVVGRPLAKARMQVFSVRVVSTIERTSLQRIAFVCQRTVTSILQPATKST